MSTKLEDELAHGLREHAAGYRLHGSVVARADRRFRRHRAVRRGAYTAGVVGLAGALAAGFAVAGDPAPAPAPPVVAEQPANLRLAAAARASAETSYRFSLSYTVGAPAGGPQLARHTEEYAGAFDPARGRGYLTGFGGRLQVRIVDREYWILRDGWRKMDGPLSAVLGIAGSRGSNGADALTADPDLLLSRLRDLGDVRYAGRQDGHDVYTFSYPVAGDDSVAGHTVTGRVEVDPATGRIARVVQETTLRGANPETADRGAITFRTVLTLSDYGVAVTVERP